MKRNNGRTAATVVVLMFLFSGCYTPSSKKWQEDTTRYMNAICEQYIGHYKSELIQKWGPPGSVSSDGKGGEVLIYDDSITSQTEGTAHINPFLNTITYNSPQVERLEKYKQMFCDSKGVIYNWRWKVGYQFGSRSAPYLAVSNTNITPAVTDKTPDKQRSIEGRLKELKALRDKGLIDEEAYKNKEKDILKEL